MEMAESWIQNLINDENNGDKNFYTDCPLSSENSHQISVNSELLYM